MPRVIRFSGRTVGFGAALGAWEERPLEITFRWMLVYSDNSELNNLPSREVRFAPLLPRSIVPSKGMNHQRRPLIPFSHLWAPILVR